MDFSWKNSRVGCHFLLQGIFLMQGSNQHLLHWQVDSFTTEPPEKPGKYLLRMHDQAQLPGSESLGWGPRIRILTSFPHSLYSKKFFLWAILKVFTEFVIILLLFYVLFFGLKACGTLARRPRILSAPHALEGEVLTTGPPGKSLPHDSYVLNLWV